MDTLLIVLLVVLVLGGGGWGFYRGAGSGPLALELLTGPRISRATGVGSPARKYES